MKYPIRHFTLATETIYVFHQNAVDIRFFFFAVSTVTEGMMQAACACRCMSHSAHVPFLDSEWLTNQHRDTYATHLGHHDQLAYIAVAQNDAVGRVRYQLLEKMLQPCGPPPAAKDDEDD